MERIQLKFCGVITEILPDGEISVCEPIFVDCWQSTFRLVTEDFRKSNTEIYTFPKDIEPIDISILGERILLPTDQSKICDGNKYFVLYQPGKNKKNNCIWKGLPMYTLTQNHLTKRDYIPSLLNVGIIFPSQFVMVPSTLRLSADEMRNLVK